MLNPPSVGIGPLFTPHRATGSSAIGGGVAAIMKRQQARLKDSEQNIKTAFDGDLSTLQAQTLQVGRAAFLWPQRASPELRVDLTTTRSVRALIICSSSI